MPAEVPRSSRNLPRFRALLGDSGARLVLTDAATREAMTRRLTEAELFTGVDLVQTDGCVSGAAPASARDIAYLQYTSGSTATPKGVIVSHANVLANLDAIDHGFRHDSASVAVTWLPHFHDMGLVYGLLAPLRFDLPCHVLSPAAFVQSPIRWLRAVSALRATHTGGPNFAYELCARKTSPEERAELDLSSWRVAYNGAEPVRRSTLEQFAAVFAPCGFRFDAFHPAYGLAEATLKVTARDPQRALHFDAEDRVSCGVPAPGTEVRIASDGEILVSGPGIAAGYWNRPEDPAFAGGVLHTGDLGAIVDGELYVAGRAKDLIILRGRNLYPQDVEALAETAHPAVRTGAVAAFAVEREGEERLVVVAELERGRESEADEAIAAIRRAVADALEARAWAVVLIRTGTIPKTSSGKIQRQAAKARWTGGELAVVAESVAGDAAPAPGAGAGLIERICLAAAELLGVPVDSDVPLTEYGLDSLVAAELSARLQTEFGVDVTAADLLAGASVSALNLRTVVPLRRAAEPVISVEQARLWTVNRFDSGNPAFHVPASIALPAPVDESRLRAAVAQVVARHETLRMTFGFDGREPAVAVHDHTPVEVHRGAARLTAPFDLAQGPLIRLSLEDNVLTLVAHHIVLDLESAGLVLREIAAAYGGEPLAPLPCAYRDYALWQRERLSSGELDGSIAFWREYLGGARPLHWPAAAAGAGATPVELPVAEALTAHLRDAARQFGTTPFVLMLAAWYAALHRYTGQEDLVVAAPVGGRPRAELRPLAGFFAYPVLLRAEVDGSGTLRELVERTKRAVASTLPHHDVPFARVVEAASAGHCSVRAPLAQTVLSVLEHDGDTLDAPAVPTDFDAFLTVVVKQHGMRAVLAHREAALGDASARALGDTWVEALRLITAAPEAAVADIRGAAASAPLRINIAATFTAEPLEPVLSFWMRELQTEARVRFAPVGQVFQSLLDPGGAFARNRSGINVVLVRASDLPGDAAAEFAAAAASAVDAGMPLLVVVCPSAGDLALPSRVPAIMPERVSGLYPVARIEDPHADALGAVPYTEDYFTALGTAVVRTVSAMRRAPWKVIALDCDQTLWTGVCGEDGPLGVGIDAPRRALQEGMVAQTRAGMLLTLCSKNNEDDVDAVFEQRSDMPLRPEHIVARRVNWRPKPDNLRALARELMLGLDSFIFIDDNRVECAAVRAALPEVLTVELPERAAEIPALLDHLWPLDTLAATAEDARRTRLYREDVERRRLENTAPTLNSFLEGLGLEVRIAGITPADLPRAAQLLARTNQFNANGVRRTEGELAELLRDETVQAHVVSASDRFGDYGTVGLMIARAGDDALRAETFLLSCRALGRGIEHRMLARLGEAACERGLAAVEVDFVPTRKNKPALQFLETAGAAQRSALGEGAIYRWTAADAARCRYHPSDETPAESEPPPVRAVSRPEVDWMRIATELRTVQQIRDKMRAQSSPRPGAAQPYVAPRTPLERELAEMWADLLHAERIGIETDFFAAGGHSLAAVQLLSRVRDRYDVELSLDVVFGGSFTVASLAEAIELWEIRHAGEQAADLLAEFEALSDDEVRELLAAEQQGSRA